jgi:hypothetical protein
MLKAACALRYHNGNAEVLLKVRDSQRKTGAGLARSCPRSILRSNDFPMALGIACPIHRRPFPAQMRSKQLLANLR